jgi:site-specific DNA-methyltransferase (adenine-specific)
MNVNNINISLIKPYEKNAKKHPKKQIEQVAKSIKEFGFNQPIVVDKDNVIIVGHGRYEASKYLKLKEVPVFIADLTEEQAKSYRLADNKLNESDWDMKLVLEELKDLSEPMLDLTGFDKDLIIESSEEDDVVPETPEEPKSKLGDLYELGGHRVLCGDSTKIEDVEKLMNGHKADMVFTDPPYNIAYEGGSKKREMIKNDEVEDFYGFLLQIYSSFALSMKLGASIYVCHADSERINFTKAFKDAGFYLSSVVIWAKNNATFGRQDYFWKHEPILYGWREGGAHTWHGDNKQDTIWNVDRPSKSEQHPTMKPIELIEKALLNSSKQEDTILDLFLGSGSTMIASEKTGRICYGMELDPKYVDVIVQRYVDYTGNENIIKNGENIIWQKTKVEDQ